MKRLDRSWTQYVDPRFTDVEILVALNSPRRYTAQALRTPLGTLYRVFGYTPTPTATRPVIAETPDGVEHLAFLVVEYVDVKDRGDIARVIWVMEADEEDFEAYG